MSSQHQIIERIVLFNVKPDVDSTKVEAMVNGLDNFTSLNLTIHVSAGKLLGSKSPLLPFTHIFHCRFKSKNELDQYIAHPEHIHVATEKVRPIIDDIMVVDWIFNGPTVSPKLGSVLRVTFLKLKENATENEKEKVLEGIKSRFKTAQELSFGENFNHEKGKGFTIASIAVLPSPADLEALDSNEELHNEITKDLIQSEIVFDYLIPSP